ncbi:MAG: response regulator [Anaerolineae bacterium]|nr:response regulator [Anaerolineae bacterium]
MPKTKKIGAHAVFLGGDLRGQADFCHWYPSGRAVVAFVRAMSMADVKHRPDLILLDIGLPHEDVYQVLAELRADPTLRGTRVAVVTANTSQQEMKRAREAGFDGFIGNPRRAIPNKL